MKNIILIILASVAIVACESAQYDLERSISVPDAEYSELPAYSEWGYNTFGAFYERKLFIFSNSEVPAKVIYTDNLARIVFKGILQEPTDYIGYYGGYYSYGLTMSLIFDLPDFHPETYDDLIDLNEKTYNLSDAGLNVTAIMGPDTIDMDIFAGELQFKRAQHLVVDKQQVGVILSGYFGFQALVDGSPVSMSRGRFDVNIDEYDFARY